MERARVAQMEAEIRKLRMENEFLKKATEKGSDQAHRGAPILMQRGPSTHLRPRNSVGTEAFRHRRVRAPSCTDETIARLLRTRLRHSRLEYRY